MSATKRIEKERIKIISFEIVSPFTKSFIIKLAKLTLRNGSMISEADVPFFENFSLTNHS